MTAWDRATAIASATTQCYLELTCTIVNTSTSTTVHNGTAYIPFAISTTSGSPTLEKGKKYNVKINIGKNSLYSGPGTKIINS
jgi:biotin synthase-related radical SAM superfamily protein